MCETSAGLFAPQGEREIRFLERSLKDSLTVAPHNVSAVHSLRKYAGVNVRGADIFHKQTVRPKPHLTCEAFANDW